MYSRMLAVLALAAAAAAYPATDSLFIPRPITTITEADFDEGPSWFAFPSLDSFFAPIWKLFPSFADIGPRIQVDDEKFVVTINVKGYTVDELKVKVTGSFIFIQGAHEIKDSDRDVSASEFIHTYSLPEKADAANITAVLYSDGYLVVTAPLNGTAERTKDSDKEIQIKTVPETYKPEVPAEPDNDDKAETTTAQPTTVADADDDRKEKEPTTPSDREEVTEKNIEVTQSDRVTENDKVTEQDNTIPHGTEASEANELNEVKP